MTIETFIRQHVPGYKNADIVIPFEVNERIFGTNDIITDYGQVEDKLLLLNEGIVQVSTMKGNEERILEFVFPGEFFSAYTSFLLQQPSDVQVTALSKSKVSVIKREHILRANQESLLSSHLSLYIAQRLFLSRARREKEFLILSAEERYKLLLEKAPEVVKLLPVNKIARYLGIQAESLSRIRRTINS